MPGSPPAAGSEFCERMNKDILFRDDPPSEPNAFSFDGTF